MQFVECATFHLNSVDIWASNTTGDYPATSAFGTVNALRNDFTFYNVDLRTILGTMYDTYDKFNIKLSSVIYSSQTPFGTGADDRCLKVNMSGLPFCNSSYHQKYNNTGYTTVGSLNLVQSNSNGSYFNDDNVFTIWKPQANANIRIYLTSMYDVAPASAGIYPHFDFYFRIYGVSKN